MKKAMVLSIALASISMLVLAENAEVITRKLWTSQSCLVNSTNFTETIDLSTMKPWAFGFGLQAQVTNNPAATNHAQVALVYQLSNDGQTFPLTSNVVTGASETNMMTSTGHSMYWHSFGPSRYLRFRAITTTTNCFINLWMSIQ